MIRAQHVSKNYPLGDGVVAALKNVSLHIRRGEFVAIVGPSGSGKSTLMNVIGCLDTVDSGSFVFSGQLVESAGEDQLAAIRNRHIGFVFQAFNLIPRLNALKNVELPMIYAGVAAADRTHRATLALEAVGLGERKYHTPAQLSGGQQQRVAIARALVNDPEMIIADEPTGSLDTAMSHDVMQLFQQLNRGGKTIVLVTHEPDIAVYARRIVQLKDGRVVADHTR